MNHHTTLEAQKKRVKFATLFQLLSDGHPMLEFESRVALYKLLSVPNILSQHWCDTSKWIMASYMYQQVVEGIRRLIESLRYVVVTVDKVTAMDKSSFLYVHAYIMQDWVRILLLISLHRVECSPNVENLTELVVGVINIGRGLNAQSIAKKVLNFGANGASTLQGP